jgi:excisionase family DNA binding protein
MAPVARGTNTSSPPNLYSVDQVAKLLGVSQKTVRRIIAAKELPVHRFGRQLRISQPDLTAFIARAREP